VIDRSTLPPETVVDALEELFPVTGSVVVLVMFAVFVIIVPPGVAMLTVSTMLKVAEAPEASVVIEQLTEPVPPTAGFVQVNNGPTVCASETNVVFDGVASVRETLCASLGPLLVTLTV
jgi:hypothetical protein